MAEIPKSPDALLQWVLDTAARHGATSADALFVEGHSTEVGVRLGETEQVKRSRQKGVGLRVFKGRSTATTSTSDLNAATLEALIHQTCDAATVTADDPYAGLPERDAFGGGGDAALDLFDPTVDQIDVESALAMALAAETASRDADPAIENSEGAEMSWGSSTMHFANSLGIRHDRRSSSVSLWATPVAHRGDEMQRDYWYTWSRHRDALMDPEEVGRRAAARALRRLGARKPETCRVPVIFEAPMASRLLGSLAGAISGGSIYRKASYLCGMVGETIATSAVTIVDNPHLARGPASRLYDGEGLPTRPLTVVQDGVLKSYILDTYTARKIGGESTRHASRGLGGTPAPSTSNFWMNPGEQTLEELIASTERGLFVTELFGFGVNTVTGDYSQGAAGLWIEDGQLTDAVNEFTIASTLPAIWNGIDGMANDRVTYRATSAPSFRVDGMTLAGA
jgi:PmbA protein